MKYLFMLLGILFYLSPGYSQEKATGPVIKGFGEAWDIPAINTVRPH